MRRRRRATRLVGLVLAAVAVVVLWPATWGGITGLTIVNGHSMEPTFSSGDLVVTVRQFSYAVGDVVS
ncbi:S26 family signal peptidase, partial [Streptomyces scabiei]